MKNYWIIIMLALFIGSCGDSPVTEENKAVDEKQALLERILELEPQVFTEEKGLDKTMGNQLLQAYITFTNNYHDDTNRCEFTLRAADIAQGLQRYSNCLALYTNLHEGCPGHDMQEEAAYMIAVVHHDFLNDRETAKKHYEYFIETYPDHHLAKDAQARISMLYMTDSQLIEKFKKQNANQANNE